jgi:predicted RecB family nuclease
MGKTKRQSWLSKTKIKNGQECSLRLYYDLNGEKAVWDKQDLFVFEQGRKIEALARSLFFSNGSVEQNKVANQAKINLTRKFLAQNKKTIFEAAFGYKKVIVQFDVLTKLSNGTYKAIEIKSSSNFNKSYWTDVLIQYWVATLNGINISEFELWHVNKKATRINKNYFSKKNVMKYVKANRAEFDRLVSESKAIQNMKSAPKVNCGSQCSSCPFKHLCHPKANRQSVLNLPQFSQSWKAYHNGIKTINHAKFAEAHPNYVQKFPHVLEAIKDNSLVINKKGFLKEYKNWKFPLNFFDFETFTNALPILEGQIPYQQLVVQFSNHTWNGSSISMKHQEFIHDTAQNPYKKGGLIQALLKVLEANKGSIVSYNMTFEKTRLLELAKTNPKYSRRLKALASRLVDLRPLIEKNVYHPSFNGSFSLKSVSATLLKEFGSYTDSLIKSGSEISRYYQEMIETTDKQRFAEIKKSLSKYCCYDTLNLRLVIDFILNQDLKRTKKLVEVNLGLKD